MRMKVTEYAATTEKKWELNLMDMGEYKRKFTFYSDLSIAECTTTRRAQFLTRTSA